MAGFDWNTFYTIFKTKLEKTVKCTVGRYVTPKESQFPYVDLSIGDNSGGNYDLDGNEGSQNPMLVVTVYSTGSLADATCEQISQSAKKVMLSYWFQCRGGPMPVINAADPNIKRWVGRYQRIFADGDEI
ncbi:hypothetical protein MUY40_28170 [Blautia sp. NSJ-159]|uniref:hypothetical protein n=1 Tax=unclassified Blautia TaxID=2648079 RepID=UPI000CDA8CA0|nr:MULTISPECIES: hypothetical protein [unclassified Blautia]MCJ8020818.1 hypothetical protein [Blautia sp. NSJ-159]MCJ8043700.1 hypothetical protein [Blautia sp. NSJ-165]POP36507.1 hypothetical protein C3R19_19640 [Blautia producta]